MFSAAITHAQRHLLMLRTSWMDGWKTQGYFNVNLTIDYSVILQKDHSHDWVFKDVYTLFELIINEILAPRV